MANRPRREHIKKERGEPAEQERASVEQEDAMQVA